MWIAAVASPSAKSGSARRLTQARVLRCASHNPLRRMERRTSCERKCAVTGSAVRRRARREPRRDPHRGSSDAQSQSKRLRHEPVVRPARERRAVRGGRRLHEQRRRRQPGAERRPEPGSGRARLPDRLHQAARSSCRPPRERRARAARLPAGRRPLRARPRLAFGERPQRHRRDHARRGRRARRRAVVRRHAAGLRHARTADRGRGRGRPADLEHLGIRHDRAATAARDPVRHRRRGRPRHCSPLPA